MKWKKYHINLYIIVPLIFSCLALLSLVSTYRLTLFCLNTGKDTLQYLVFWGAVISLVTYSTGLLISRIILRPIEEFVEKAESHPAVHQPIEETEGSRDQLSRFTTVFTQLTDLLSKVDAREYFPEIIGQSNAIRGILSQILKVGSTDATVLITGESGTGKEVIARAIHRHSNRSDKPFIAVNCAAIPEGLLESELFGHEKGAFTGAVAIKKGKFEAAHEGTIFLDEIGDMSLETQAKILRALEAKVCERVGGNRPIAFDVRVLAATNRDLTKRMEQGEFREDLYHRLNVFPITLPPLRDRREDIPLLCSHFLQQFGADLSISSEALQLLMAGAWTGNVRELRNLMERAAVLSERGEILPRHIAGHVVERKEPKPSEEELAGGISLDEKLAEYEKTLIVAALSHSKGVQVRAAELLGIKDRSLWHRIKKYEINVETLKS